MVLALGGRISHGISGSGSGVPVDLLFDFVGVNDGWMDTCLRTTLFPVVHSGVDAVTIVALGNCRSQSPFLFYTKSFGEPTLRCYLKYEVTLRFEFEQPNGFLYTVIYEYICVV